jgi:hypothetical protein
MRGIRSNMPGEMCWKKDSGLCEIIKIFDSIN